MVARGDLGIELPIEHVPIVQKQLLELAGWMARPSITATQMLDSMVASSRPTRAEVADVANAILDGTDAVMLSQETAVGAYPVEAVAMMAAVAVQAEAIAPYERWNDSRVRRTESDPAYTIAHNLCAGRARAAPRRADRADAVRALGAPGLRAPPDGADLRALPGQRDGPPLRADVGRAGRLDAPPRDDRGADRRRRPARRRARLVQDAASAWASPPGCPPGGPARRASCRSRCSSAQSCRPPVHRRIDEMRCRAQVGFGIRLQGVLA